MAGFTFADLFCGIGGFHAACHSLGGRCVLACDIDQGARELYRLNWGTMPHDDIRTLPVIKNIDLLCAGPPCQAFSTIGQRRGTKDARGELMYVLCDYIATAQPKAFIIENVKALTSARYQRSFEDILASLRGAGYVVSWQVLDASDFGAPQHRERVYITGIRGGGSVGPIRHGKAHRVLADVLDRVADPGLASHVLDAYILPNPQMTPTGFQIIAQKNQYTDGRVFGRAGIIGTILASGPPLVFDGSIIRHLSIPELRRIQGFPARFKMPVSRTDAGHYFGNAVCVPVVKAVAREVLATLAKRG